MAVADVDALVKAHPWTFTPAKTPLPSIPASKLFPMLPERLSTDLTSLNENEDRSRWSWRWSSTLTEKRGVQVYRAWVRKKAKLAYNGVGDWLEGKGPLPPAAARVPGMDVQLDSG